MNDVHIVTIATESKYYFKYLQETCKKNGKELEVLGYGEEWKGFNWRLHLIINYLKKINPSDIVVFVDGYDVICIRNLLELKELFLTIKSREKCKIIVAEDKIDNNIWMRISQYYYFGTCKNSNINAGTYIGTAEDILYVLTNVININSDEMADDQILLTKYCNLNNNDVYIDIYNEIFVAIGSMFNEIDHRFKITNNEIIFDDKYKPFFIHGPFSTFLDEIIIKMGIYNNDNVKKSIREDFWNKKVYQLSKNFIYEHTEFIIIFVIIIILIIVIYYKRNKLIITNYK